MFVDRWVFFLFVFFFFSYCRTNQRRLLYFFSFHPNSIAGRYQHGRARKKERNQQRSPSIDDDRVVEYWGFKKEKRQGRNGHNLFFLEHRNGRHARAVDSDDNDGNSMDHLPDELLALAFSFVPCIDVHLGVASACRRWRRIALDRTAVGRPFCVYAGLDLYVGLFEGINTDEEGHPDHARVWRDAAAAAGHLDCLLYGREQGRPWDEGTCAFAACNGRLEALRHLHVGGCPWDSATISVAAENGHLTTLRYAVESGCPKGERVCDDAVRGGHLDCLRYLHEQGYPWSEYTCGRAAKSKDLDCLRYAHQNGAPWNKHEYLSAAEGGSLECLRYVHENGSD